MAQEISEMPAGLGPDTRSKYPWSDWLNGRPWELEPGVDFTMSPLQMTRRAHAVARYRGLQVRTSVQGGRAFIQAFRNEPGDMAGVPAS